MQALEYSYHPFVADVVGGNVQVDYSPASFDCLHQRLHALVAEVVLVDINHSYSVVVRLQQNESELCPEPGSHAHLREGDLPVDADSPAQVLEALELHGVRGDLEVLALGPEESHTFLEGQGRRLGIDHIAGSSLKGYGLLDVHSGGVYFLLVDEYLLEQRGYVGHVLRVATQLTQVWLRDVLLAHQVYLLHVPRLRKLTLGS